MTWHNLSGNSFKRCWHFVQEELLSSSTFSHCYLPWLLQGWMTSYPCITSTPHFLSKVILRWDITVWHWQINKVYFRRIMNKEIILYKRLFVFVRQMPFEYWTNIFIKSSCIVELASDLVLCASGPRFKTWCRDIFWKECNQKNILRCFKSWSLIVINSELTLSSVQMRDQHFKVCMHVGHSFGLCG